MKEIFPKEILEYSQEVHRYRHGKRSLAIYTAIWLTIIMTLGSLPFIKIPIYSSARGIIRPAKERLKVQLIHSGQITFSALKNNKKVAEGDTLLKLDDHGLNEKLDFIKAQIDDHQSHIYDLETLLQDHLAGPHSFTSALYQEESNQYRQKLQAYLLRFQGHKRDMVRKSQLIDKGVISQVEFEQAQDEYRLARSDLLQFKKQQKNTWQAELNGNQKELRRLEQERNQLLETRSHYAVIAPASGSLLNVTPLKEKSFVNAGTFLAEISPDAELVAECYLSPGEVGLIAPGDEVSFQIDAFNYNQWGQASGHVLDISKDVEFVNEQPVFKVQCELNERLLKLKNGYRGQLIKGLTLTANFKLTDRTLYNLLYDQWDDWLNPGIKY